MHNQTDKINFVSNFAKVFLSGVSYCVSEYKYAVLRHYFLKFRYRQANQIFSKILRYALKG